MESSRIWLEACDPALGCFRSYRIGNSGPRSRWGPRAGGVRPSFKLT